ncbi:hypothetical protein EQU24_18075 [Methylotuvimicrobium buryatense]|uniref:Uncharacterized protein n=1 Tax=Methylotuvimicrobium buryatense TaxID=95641 RepID=A0A4P9UR41_METBY|nr:hypothetical protein EQU24_18075 [Methylotuvimicrobium buryatense]
MSHHFTIHYSLFTIHYSLFTIHYSLFTIHYSLFTIHYLLFTAHAHGGLGFGHKKGRIRKMRPFLVR